MFGPREVVSRADRVSKPPLCGLAQNWPSVSSKGATYQPMPCLGALCMAFALGVLFAHAHRETISRQEHSLQAPGAWLVVAFGVLFSGPVLGYLMVSNPAWALSYWLDPSRLPSMWGLVLTLSYAVLPLLGFVVAAGPVMAGRIDRLLALMSLATGVTVLAFIGAIPRMLVVGSIRQYQNGFGLEPLAGSPLGLSLVWTVLVCALVVTWVVHRLRKLSELHIQPFLPPQA